MVARIIELAAYRAKRTETCGQARVEARSPAGPDQLAGRFHFWTGGSGRRYVHTIYSLVECPALPAGNYMLVSRDEAGRRHILAIGHAGHEAASLNLAEIRQCGAALGANEVHVHLLAGSEKLAKLVEFDLKAAQMTGTADAVQPTVH